MEGSYKSEKDYFLYDVKCCQNMKISSWRRELQKSTIWSVCRQVFTVEEYFRNFRRERNIFKCCRRDARAAEERCAVIWKHLSPRFRINAVEKLSGWKATGGARVLVSRSGRGGCVTLVWVLTGHRGGRRAEQGRRRQLAVEEEEEEAAGSIANSTPSTHRPAFTLTFLWSLKGKGSPIASSFWETIT